MGAPSEAGYQTVVVGDATPAGLDSLIMLERARANLLGRESAAIAVGRYVVQRKLGAGGMGIVYEAYDSDLDRVVALKVLRSELARNEEHGNWLLREAKALAKLSHPNVVVVYEVGRHEDAIFLSMELVQGQTLRAWVRESEPSWAEIVAKYLQAGHGLIAAHDKGIVHRDFKPDNVLLGDDGRVRVLDFGLAQPDIGDASSLAGDAPESPDTLDTGNPTMTGTIAGTPAYMDPQRLLGHRASLASDQYAFCVSLYEALYGRRPYEASSVVGLLRRIELGQLVPPASGSPRVPRRLHAAIMRGLAFAPEGRHADMRALVAALEQARRPARTWIPVVATAGVLALGGWFIQDDASALGTVTEASSDDVENDGRAAVISASKLPDPVTTPLPDDLAGVTVHRLANGLTVYIAHRPDRPRLSTRVVVRAGLAEETPQTRGVAGLTLAAIRKGGQRLGAGDFAAEAPLLERQHALLREAAKLEGEARDRLVTEAHQAYRETGPMLARGDASQLEQSLGLRARGEWLQNGIAIASEVPASRFEAWAQLQAEVLRRPAFRGFTAAAAERSEQIKWFYSGAEVGVAMDTLLAEAGGAAPDPDAEVELLRSFPLDAVVAFHRTYYVPNNLAIVIVGDIRPDEALPALEAAFGDWEPRPLPKSRAHVDRPWPGERRFISIDNPRGKSVVVGFPLPPPSDESRPAFEALSHVLRGQEGLLQSRLGKSRLAAGANAFITSRGFVLAGGVLEGVTHEETEAALTGVIDAIAHDRIDEQAWRRALAHRELAAAEWARSPEQLADLLADSYVDRRQWTEHAPTLAPRNVSKEDIVAAAKRLLERGTAVLHTVPGEPWRPRSDGLDLPTLPPAADESTSRFGEALLAHPVREVEPRFLVDGRHFSRERFGDAELITADAAGPLFYATWVFPVGVRHDAFVCDAARYRADLWVDRLDALAASFVSIRCGPTSTTFEITGVADRYDEIMHAMSSVLLDTEVDEARLEDQVRRTVETRRKLRDDPIYRAEALHAFALRREASLDRWMPTDADLQAAPAARFERALGTLTDAAPSILYAGPRPERVRTTLSPSRGDTRAVELLPIDPPERSTVYVMAAPPGSPATLHLSISRTGEDDTTRLYADAFALAPAPGLAQAEGASVAVSRRTSRLFGAQPAHIWSYAGPRDALFDVIDGALEELGHASPRESMATLRPLLEDEYRLSHVPDGRIPDVVLAWGHAQTLDPLMQRWASIGRLTDAGLGSYLEAVAHRPVVVSVVADLDDAARTRLKRWGDVVEPDPTTFVRDTARTDTLAASPR